MTEPSVREAWRTERARTVFHMAAVISLHLILFALLVWPR